MEPTDQQHSGSGDNVEGDKIERQINFAEGGTYNERPTIVETKGVFLVAIAAIAVGLITFLVIFFWPRPDFREFSVGISVQEPNANFPFEGGLVMVTTNGFTDSVPVTSSDRIADFNIPRDRYDQKFDIRSEGFGMYLAVEATNVEIPDSQVIHLSTRPLPCLETLQITISHPEVIKPDDTFDLKLVYHPDLPIQQYVGIRTLKIPIAMDKRFPIEKLEIAPRNGNGRSQTVQVAYCDPATVSLLECYENR